MTNAELANLLRSLRHALARCVQLCDEVLRDLEGGGEPSARLIKKIEHKATVLFVLTNQALHRIGIHAAQERAHRQR